jgi:hypothetical protein
LLADPGLSSIEDTPSSLWLTAAQHNTSQHSTQDVMSHSNNMSAAQCSKRI